MDKLFIAGVDEAGRGPLAGPVMAAAVILNPEKEIKGLNDSKLLTEKKRDALYDLIYEHALAVSVGRADVEEIDRINILQASLLAMQRAVAGLKIRPHLALVDGNQSPKLACETKTIIRGDQLEPAISAASIIAKVPRAIKVKVRAQDENGKFFELEGEGLLSHCLQHEIDHLDGKLYIDYLSPLKRQMLIKKMNKFLRHKE